MADLVPDVGSIQPPPGGGLVPDEGSIQAPREPGMLEAAGRGALQGVSLGFADEAQGALESLFTDKTYAQARDAARAANLRAQQAHSTLYGGGEVVGGLTSALIPGLNIGKAATLGTVAAKSALAGGLGALGGSEATDVGGLAKDVGTGALEGGIGGAVAHGVGGAVGKLLGKAPEAADAQALKALIAGEGDSPGASVAAITKAKNSPAARTVLHEEVTPGSGETLASIAGSPAEKVKPYIEALKEKVGREDLDPVYAKADKATGGVKVSDLIRRYDEEIADLKLKPVNEPYVQALEEARDSAMKAWAPKMAEELDRRQAPGLSSVRDAIINQFDQKVPSADVRQLATELQNRGASNVANPKVGTQVKQYLAQTTRDFVNDHVGNSLGEADRKALESANARMSTLYAIGNALEERAAKEGAGKTGLANTLLGHGGMVGAGMMAMHGNLPGAAAALVLPKVVEHLPQAGRFATTQAAKANTVLQQIMAAADRGNPWAASQIRMLRSSPVGAARLAQLAPTIAAPVDQQAEAP